MSVESVVSQAESLIKSLRGVRGARVQADATGRITRVDVVTSQAGDSEDRSTVRNVQSAVFAVLGVQVDPAVMHFSRDGEPVVVAAPARSKQIEPESRVAQVLEISGMARKADLNVAARAAFDTLRAAQSSFHGFAFDGAEVVTINEQQYIVVAVRRAATEARYCGAAPIIDSVSTASARALMNAVGIAAMGGAPAFEFGADFDQPEVRKA